MKKIFILFIFLFCFSSSSYAGTIYCFSANKGNEILKSTIPTDLINSTRIRYFIIDDKKKIFKQIKGFLEFREEIKYDFEDNNQYQFFYYGQDQEKFWNEATYLKFNKNEILVDFDYDTKSGKKRRYKFELDRIAGILLTGNVALDETGEEIVTDEEGMIYKKEDDEFTNYYKQKKFFCEKHKDL